MLGNNQTSIAASRNYTGVYYQELENNPAPPWVAKVFKIIMSSVITEIISFIKGTPQMRKWIGERRIQSMSQYTVTVTKEDHELTVGISRDDLMFDKFGNIADQIKSIAQAVPRHFVQFFVDLLLGGFTTLAYDGADFFSASHPNGAGAVYSNTTDQALSITEYELAQTRASKIINTDTGQPLDINFSGPDAWLFYAPNAHVAQLNLFGLSRLAGGQENIYYNAIPESNRVRLGLLGNSAKWFLFDLSKILKPFILMIVKGVDFIPFDSPNDWIAFSKKEYVYGIDTMDAAQYFMPELGYGSSVA